MSSDSNDTSIALLSQKVDLYRDESVSQRASINLQLLGISGLLEVHVKNIGERLDDHDARITKNATAIAEASVADGKRSGAETARGWIFTTLIAGAAAVGTWLGLTPHH